MILLTTLNSAAAFARFVSRRVHSLSTTLLPPPSRLPSSFSGACTGSRSLLFYSAPRHLYRAQESKRKVDNQKAMTCGGPVSRGKRADKKGSSSHSEGEYYDLYLLLALPLSPLLFFARFPVFSCSPARSTQPALTCALVTTSPDRSSLPCQYPLYLPLLAFCSPSCASAAALLSLPQLPYLFACPHLLSVALHPVRVL
jgi:hypothetical protein